MTQQQAFDPLAPTYDDHFTNTTIGQYLRGLVQARLAAHFRAGDHVLELGCGTGEDALWLAGRGVRVTATDVSEGMLEAARAKCVGNELVQVARLDLKKLPVASYQLPVENLNRRDAEDTETRQRERVFSEVSEREQFDGVFSNFGPMNCLSEWRTLAGWLAERMKTDGIVGLGVMSPLCLWEPLWHGLHGNFKVATRRWRKSVVFQSNMKQYSAVRKEDLNRRGAEDADIRQREGLFSGEAITVTYPTIRRITQEFEPHFRRAYVRGLGVFLPPSDVYGVIEKRPQLLKLLMGLERRWGAYSKLALLADHYWVEFERK